MKSITLIIPVHNEGKKIEETARALVADPGVGRLADFIFVVDGCIETKEAIERAIDRSGAKVLFFWKGMGKGRAVWEGFRASSTEYVGFLDADEPVPLPAVESACAKFMKEKADCIIASRTKIHGRSLIRTVSSRAFNLLVRALFPLPFPDTQCGFKLFRKSLLGEEPFFIEGYAFDVELLLRIKRKGGKIIPYPVEATERNGGKFSILAAPGMLIDLIRLKLSS